MKRPTIVCLCGSTRFYQAFKEANYRETMAGKIVLSVGFATTSEHGEAMGCTPEQKKALDELHLHKIDLADEVLVINVDGYIGESTTNEVKYAYAYGNDKKVYWLEPDKVPEWCLFSPLDADGYEKRNQEGREAAKALLSTLTAEQLEDIRGNHFPSSRWSRDMGGPPFHGYDGMRKAVLAVLEENDG